MILLSIINLSILASDFDDFSFLISQSLNSFKMNYIIINIILFFLLLYGINEILNITNITSSIDNFLKRHSYKAQKILLLIFSTFSTNFDFSNSKIINKYNFYNFEFLMSTFNLISLISIEILLILLFINSSFINIWFSFFVLNFFVIIWFWKKIVDILKNKFVKFDLKKESISSNFQTNEKGSEFKYNKKYNVTKKALMLAILFNLIITFIVNIELNTRVLEIINIFLLLSFVELLIYGLFLIYKEDNLEELTFYKKIVSSYTYSFSHLIFLFLSLVLLKTNILIYSNFLNANRTINIQTFIFLLIFTSLITFMAQSYITIFAFVFPLILLLSNNNIILFSFFTSFILIIYFYKNIKSKSFNTDILFELIYVLLGGILSFLILTISDLFVTYLFILVYTLVLYTVYKFILTEDIDG